MAYLLDHAEYRYGEWERQVKRCLLDLIAREEIEARRPDITFLVINSKTGYPSQIGFEPAKPPTEAQKNIVQEEWRKIDAYYS